MRKFGSSRRPPRGSCGGGGGACARLAAGAPRADGLLLPLVSSATAATIATITSSAAIAARRRWRTTRVEGRRTEVVTRGDPTRNRALNDLRTRSTPSAPRALGLPSHTTRRAPTDRLWERAI